MTNIIKIYFKNVETGNIEAIINLFSEDGIVHSPLYGDIPAKDFYEDLFADTSQSIITLINTFEAQIILTLPLLVLNMTGY
jgi:ketosteroid isomerase-like protein